MKKFYKKSAFTLVELSIVILVLAFLVSGMLVGRAIVTRARLQSIVTEINNIKRGYKLFSDQLGGVPGDITATQCALSSSLSSFNSTTTDPFCGSSSTTITGSTITLGGVSGYNAGTLDGSITVDYTNASVIDFGVTIPTTGIGAKGDSVISTGLEMFYAIRELMITGYINFPTGNIAIIDSNSAAKQTLFNGMLPYAAIRKANFPTLGNISGVSYGIAGITTAQATTGSTYNLLSPYLSLIDLSQWRDQNAIVLFASGDYTLPAISVSDAISLKIKVDGGQNPFIGNIVLSNALSYTNGTITETNSTGSLISSSSTATTAYENSTDCVIYKASFVSGTGNCQTFSDGTATKTLTACTATVGSGGYTINANGSCRVSFLIQ